MISYYISASEIPVYDSAEWYTSLVVIKWMQSSLVSVMLLICSVWADCCEMAITKRLNRLKFA